MGEILPKIGLSIFNAIEEKLNEIIQLSPYILGALGVFLFGWIFAEVVARMVLAFGRKVKLEVLSEKMGIKRFLERRKVKMTATVLLAKTLKAYFIFLFFIEATKIARFTQVADFLSTIYSYIPSILIALFIMLVGIQIGQTLQVVISTSLSFAKAHTSEVLGRAAKYTVITFAILAALAQLQIAAILIQILFIGFVGMLMIAGGLAIGLGGKDVVHEMLDDLKHEINIDQGKSSRG
jgi:Conserved TM helix